MAKLIFYGWEVGMRSILFAKLLKEKTNMQLDTAWKATTSIIEGGLYEVIIEDEDVANEVYEKARKYKVLVRKE